MGEGTVAEGEKRERLRPRTERRRLVARVITGFLPHTTKNLEISDVSEATFQYRRGLESRFCSRRFGFFTQGPVQRDV